MKTFYILFSFILLFSSCRELSIPSSYEGKQYLTEKNLKSINGTYKDFPNDRSTSLDFALLFKKVKFHSANLPDSNTSVKLEIIDKRHLKITVLQDGNIIKTKTKRGRILEGYFYLNQSAFFRFWFILNVVGFQQTRIGLLNNNNITLDTYQIGNGGFLVIIPIPFGGGPDIETDDLEYPRIE